VGFEALIAVRGVDYQTATQPKSDIYLALLPILNSGRAELLDHPRLTTQLCSLERRTVRGGKDSVDHPPGAHDDLVNAAAGAIVAAAQRKAQEVPLIAPIILSQSMPPEPGMSTTQAFYEWAGRTRSPW
jgi:hypothetical protein